MSSRKKLGLALVVVAAAGAGGWAAFHRGPKPTIVEVSTVGKEDVQSKVTANGKVQAVKKVDISATIPGQITQLAVNPGAAEAMGVTLPEAVLARAQTVVK